MCLLLVLTAGVLGCSGKSGDAGKTCAERWQAYADLLSSARQCSVGAADQCGVRVPADFACGCTTLVNGRAEELAVIFAQNMSAGCQSVCNGVCIQGRAFSCQADSTSSTGGRCKPQDLLDLTGADDGGSFSVTVGSEIDIVLQDVGANEYSTAVELSSEAATVLEVTIPAAPPNPAGLRHLYRLGAASVGQVVVQIPRASATTDAAAAPFMVTLTIQ